MFTKLKKAGLLALAIIPTLISTSSAFFLGSDKYTKEQYAEAGVNWVHNNILLDHYDFKGRNISQGSAEKITDLYLECFRGNKITNENFENVTSSVYHRLVSEFLDVTKKYEKENSRLRSENSSLHLENMRLRAKLSQEKEKNNQAKEKKIPIPHRFIHVLLKTTIFRRIRTQTNICRIIHQSTLNRSILILILLFRIKILIKLSLLNYVNRDFSLFFDCFGVLSFFRIL